MKTIIKRKLIKHTRTYKNKSTKTKKQHLFYINKCNNGLDTTILSRYLKKLGLIPDSKAMNYIEKQYNLIAANYKLSRAQFCDSYDRTLIVNVPSYLINADVFFYHNNNLNLDKPFYKYAKFLCNSLNIDYSMLNKNILYDNIVKYNFRNKLILKYFIKTFMLSSKDKFKFPGNYILRPIYGFDGSGILYVHNSKDLINAIKYYNTHYDYRNHLYSLNTITVSSFITDLLLFKGRKYHIRIYYMVAILECDVSCFILDIGNIQTAKEPYNLDLPYSKSVHDSHSFEADYLFPYDITPENISSLKKNNYSEHEFDTNTILKGIRLIGKGISNIVVGISKDNPTSLLYDNQQNGYYIYGLDILVRDNFEPVLIECNNQPDLSGININKNLSRIFYEWINETILEPLFKHPGHATEYARKHKTYIPLDK